MTLQRKSNGPRVLALLLSVICIVFALIDCGTGTRLGNPDDGDDVDESTNSTPGGTEDDEEEELDPIDGEGDGENDTFIEGTVEIVDTKDSPSTKGATVFLEDYKEIKAETAIDGKFRLRIPDSVFQKNGSSPINSSNNNSSIEISKEIAIYVVHDVENEKYGFKKSGFEIILGSTVQVGILELKKAGAVKGTVELSGKEDHAGIDVYLLGTTFIAKTDEKGGYEISGIPEGTWKMRAEKDGYGFSKQDKILVHSGKTTNLEKAILYVSIGVSGGIEVNGGAEISTSRDVKVNLFYSGNATLMKVSEDKTFENQNWEQVKTAISYSFDSEGIKTLYVMFANDQGLATSPLSDSITVDLFLSFEGGIQIDNGATQVANEKVTVSVNKPQNAVDMMLCENEDFSGCAWEPLVSELAFDFSGNGHNVLFGKYRDIDGYDSHVVSYSITVDSLAPVFDAKLEFDGRSTDMTINIDATDLIGVDKIKIEKASRFDAAPFVDFSDAIGIPYLPYESTIKIQLVDKLGNTSNVIEKSINYTPTRSQSSISKMWHASTVVGTKLMVAGGLVSHVVSDVVDIYDDATGVWSTATLSQGRSDIAATTVGTKAIFAGGRSRFRNPTVESNVVDIYDNATGTWSTAALSLARSGMSATSVGSKAFFAGGSAPGATSVIDIYDSDSGTWSTATLSHAGWGTSATSVGTKALFAGGVNNVSGSDVVDIYDDSTGNWTTATLSTARTGMSATSVGSKAFFAGGSESDMVDIYDDSTGTWSTATLSAGRTYLSAATIGTKAIIAGGSNNGYRSKVVDIYDDSTGNWSASVLSTSASRHAASGVGNKAFFIHDKGIEIYDNSTGEWKTTLP